MAISIGDALLKLGVDTKDLDKGMQGLGDRIKKHQKAIGIGMVAAGGAILAAGALSIKTFAEMGDEVQKMALRTGFSTEALSELRHAAEISGASLSTLEKGVKRMSGTILDAQDGLETYIRAFQHIGIEVEDLEELDPEEQFLRIAEAIAELEDPTKRAAIAQDIFGRAGTELLPLFAAGKEGLADLREEAHKLGIVFDQEAANKAAEMTDAMGRMEQSIAGVQVEIADQLIPVLLPLINYIKDIISGITAWMKEHPRLTKVIVIGTAVLGGLLVVLGGLLLIMPGLIATLPLLGLAFHAALGPIGLITLAITALIAIGIALWQNWDEVVAFFGRAWQTIKIHFLTQIDKILEALERFMGWIPGLGDKIREVRENVRNMIDTEKVKQDLATIEGATEETFEDMGEQAKELTETIKAELEDEKAARLEALDAELAAAQENHDKTIAWLWEKYGETKATTKSEIDLAREARDAKIGYLDDEMAKSRQYYDERVQQFEDEYRIGLSAITRGYQDKIDAIDALTEKEAKDVRIRERNEEIAALTKALREEHDGEKRTGILKKLEEAQAKRRRDLTLEARDNEKDYWRARIAAVREGTDETAVLLRKATDEKIAAEKEVLDATLSRLEFEKIAENTALTKAIEQIEMKRDAAIAAEAARLVATEARLSAETAALRDEYARRETDASIHAEAMGRLQPGTAITGPSEALRELETWPGLQRGGIAMRPMLARIGERSPEAVIPLDRLNMLTGRGFAQTLNIYLDGEIIGRYVINQVGQQAKLQGAYP